MFVAGSAAFYVEEPRSTCKAGLNLQLWERETSVTAETKARVIVGVLSALAMGGIIWAAFVFGNVKDFFFRDDDRPPIIVRGGSIEFETEPPNPQGHAWNDPRGNKRFRPSQAGGKAARSLRLYFVLNSSCTPLETSRFTVAFDHDGDGMTAAREYAIDVSTPGPPIVTGQDLGTDPNNRRRLFAGTQGAGAIEWVTTAEGSRCPATGLLDRDTQIWVEMVK